MSFQHFCASSFSVPDTTDLVAKYYAQGRAYEYSRGTVSEFLFILSAWTKKKFMDFRFVIQRSQNSEVIK